jgi:hypothetical protein
MWQLLTVFPQNMAKFCKRNSEKIFGKIRSPFHFRFLLLASDKISPKKNIEYIRCTLICIPIPQTLEILEN